MNDEEESLSIEEQRIFKRMAGPKKTVVAPAAANALHVSIEGFIVEVCGVELGRMKEKRK